MRKRLLVASLIGLSVSVSPVALAQSGTEIRYPDGTVIQPLPIVPGVAPNGDIEVTGSVNTLPAPPVRRTAPLVAPSADELGCRAQSYIVASGERVRVHRC
jgi:hypothetical protein